MNFRPLVNANLLVVAFLSAPVRADPSQKTRVPLPAASAGLPAEQVAPFDAARRLLWEVAPKLGAVRVASAPKLDGRLDDPAWATTPGTSDFTQQIPYDGLPPTERTTMRVVYDDEALYFGFDCPQIRTPVVGRLTRRDEDSESEWVWVHIDSRRDARTSFLFAVNVQGVLSDALVHDGLTTSIEWDENWDARAALTKQGWSAEMRIPFRVLRFTPDLATQDWGLWASRFIAVSQEKDDWPYIPRDVAAPIPFFGRLTDLQRLSPGGALELRPFGLGQVAHRTNDASLVKSGFDAGISGGLDLKLHVTQSLTFDAAVNPDFAQVEADQLILNLNNYEIEYPEKRPLFLEGADLFATPLGVFYSRRIGSSPATPLLRSDALGGQSRLVEVPDAAAIYGAAKFSGRFRQAWTFGLLSALSSRNEYEVQAYDAGGVATGTPARHTVEPLTLFNVLRLRRDLGDRAQVGVIATNTTRFEDTDATRVCPAGGDPAAPGQRCFRGATVAGVDATWRSSQADYVVAGQLIGSVVSNGRPETQRDGVTIGPNDRGLGGWVRLAKDGGRHFLAEATYTGLGRRLMYNDLGYMARQNLHEGKVGLELRSLEPGRLTLERHLRLDLRARRNLEGLDLGMMAELSLITRTKAFWSYHLGALAAPASFDDREVGDGTALERARYLGAKVDISSDPRARWGVGVKGEVRFLEAGTWIDAQLPLTLRALPQFAIDLTPQLRYSSGEQRLAWHAAVNDSTAAADPYIFGRLLARSASATLRIAYTFTPRLSLQTFAQLFLSSEHFDDFRQVARGVSRVRLRQLMPALVSPPDADSQQAALNVNVVVRWEYRLGSTLFVVYSRSQTPDIELGPSVAAALRLSAVGKAPSVDTILVKLSFWWAS